MEKEIQEMLLELENDKSSGANELISKVIKILQKQLDLITDERKDEKKLIIELAERIMDSRPSMAPLINTVGYIIADLEYFSKSTLSRRIAKFLEIKEQGEKQLKSNFISFMKQLLNRKTLIMTISYSSTIINLLKKLTDYDLELFILESRPLFEGRKTAEILSSHFKTHLIVDAAMGKFMEKIDLVLLGIDSVLNDGSVINKIGSFPLATVAFENNKKCYALGTSLKFNLKSYFNREIVIKDKKREEIYDRSINNKNLEIHNLYFDITPPKYIARIISDLGVLVPAEFVSKAKEILPLEWFRPFLINNH